MSGCLFQVHWAIRQWVAEDVGVSLSNALGHEAMGGRGCQGVSFKCTGPLGNGWYRMGQGVSWAIRQWVVEDVRVSLSHALGH